MVSVKEETVALWVVLLVNSVFLSGRLYLRLRGGNTKRTPRSLHDKSGGSSQSLKLSPSDYILIFAYLVILGETVLLSWANMPEIRYLTAHPNYNSIYDPMYIGVSRKDRVAYQKVIFAMVFINLFALWAAKAALLVFLYEIFPRHLWKPLHMASGILIVGFVSNLVGSAAWCRPAKLAWKPDIIKHPKSHGYCFSKGDPTYNTIQFTVHVFSTLVVVLLPILLLYRVPARRSGELAFALSSLSFGIISVAASAAAFASLVWMMQERHALLGGARHATMISLVADQNAIFLGACLNVIRIWKNRDGDDLEGHDTELTTTTTTRTEVETKGLVIEVERRWSVHVDIVESWGHGWRDPWEQRSGHEMVL